MNPFRTILDGYRWLTDPYGFLDRAREQHGMTFRARLPVLGSVLMTGDGKLIDEIMKHKHLDGGKSVAALRAILGSRSLIMLEGDVHAARRRLIAPSFRGEGLAAQDEITRRITRETLLSLPQGSTFRVYDVIRRIGLKVMVAAMFGEDNEVAPQAEEVIERFLSSFRNPLILFLKPLRVDLGRWSSWGRAMRNRQELCDLIRGQMQTVRSSPNSESILGRLVLDAAGLMSDEDLIEEVLSLLMFGHDTAAATMAWAFVHIFNDRNVVEHIRDESGDEDVEPTAEAMPYLNSCLQESMRLCPVVVHLSRTASADLRIGAHEVRRGEKVIPCTYLAQHNPEVFPEPHRFSPERFLQGRRYEHSFFPFGFGNRTCVGKPFALRQMLLVLSTAARYTEMALAPGYRPTPSRHLVLIVPRDGGLMRAHVRGHRGALRANEGDAINLPASPSKMPASTTV